MHLVAWRRRRCQTERGKVTITAGLDSDHGADVADLSCPDCEVTLVRVERNARVSGGGLLSVVLFLAGLATLGFHFLAGVIIWILAAVVGLRRSKIVVMVCPRCKRDITSLS